MRKIRIGKNAARLLDIASLFAVAYIAYKAFAAVPTVPRGSVESGPRAAPSAPAPEHTKAWSLLQSGHLQETQDEFLKALAVNPADQEARHGLVVVRRYMAGDSPRVLKQQASEYWNAIRGSPAAEQRYSRQAMETLLTATLQAADEIEAQTKPTGNRPPDPNDVMPATRAPLAKNEAASAEVVSPIVPARMKPNRAETSDALPAARAEEAVAPPRSSRDTEGVISPRALSAYPLRGSSAKPSAAITVSPSTKAVSPAASASRASTPMGTEAAKRRVPASGSAWTPRSGPPAIKRFAASQHDEGYKADTGRGATPNATLTNPARETPLPNPPHADPTLQSPAPSPHLPAGANDRFYMIRITLPDGQRAAALAKKLALTSSSAETVTTHPGFTVVSEPLPPNTAETLRTSLSERGFHCYVARLAADAAQLVFGTYTTEQEADALAQRIAAAGYDAWVRGGSVVSLIEIARSPQSAIDTMTSVVKSDAPEATISIAPVP